jgi:hypothetical protein
MASDECPSNLLTSAMSRLAAVADVAGSCGISVTFYHALAMLTGGNGTTPCGS